MPKDNEQWGQKFGAMKELIEHHMEEEEEEFFTLARKEFSEEEAQELGRRFDSRKKVVAPAITPMSEG